MHKDTDKSQDMVLTFTSIATTERTSKRPNRAAYEVSFTSLLAAPVVVK